LKLAQFLLRYVVIAGVVFGGYTLDLFSLPAVFVGLSSFVVAMFVEALREFYFAIKQREEIGCCSGLQKPLGSMPKRRRTIHRSLWN
jgi:hypothetical protein